MPATQTITTTTTRQWKKKDSVKKTGKAVAKAYSAQLKKAKAQPKVQQKAKSSRRRCPTCGRPL